MGAARLLQNNSGPDHIPCKLLRVVDQDCPDASYHICAIHY